MLQLYQINMYPPWYPAGTVVCNPVPYFVLYATPSTQVRGPPTLRPAYLPSFLERGPAGGHPALGRQQAGRSRTAHMRGCMPPERHGKWPFHGQASAAGIQDSTVRLKTIVAVAFRPPIHCAAFTARVVGLGLIRTPCFETVGLGVTQRLEHWPCSSHDSPWR